MAQAWKNGRGKLGIFAPLIGAWRAEAGSPMGPVACTRTFAPILSDTFIQLDVAWTFRAPKGAAPRIYSERAIFGPDKDGSLGFWSFTSDGKRSQGVLADGGDVAPGALCFEAQMGAGRARQIYWPDADSGIRWAVESRNKKGWNRFTEHLYKPA
jgi:hypothetical protein